MNWEQRFHPLRKEWVIVAGHRGERPWSGASSGAHQNPKFSGVCVFDDDPSSPGPEIGARVYPLDAAPEARAEALRAVPATHYGSLA